MPPDPMRNVLGRLGYVRRDHADQAVALPNDPELPTYPPVVMIQGHSTGESWVRDHAGQLMVAAGVGVLGLAALAVVALVAILTAVAMVTCAAALGIAKAAGSQARPRGRWSR
jgi:hypothetical protein